MGCDYRVKDEYDKIDEIGIDFYYVYNSYALYFAKFVKIMIYWFCEYDVHLVSKKEKHGIVTELRWVIYYKLWKNIYLFKLTIWVTSALGIIFFIVLALPQEWAGLD